MLCKTLVKERELACKQLVDGKVLGEEIEIELGLGLHRPRELIVKDSKDVGVRLNRRNRTRVEPLTRSCR